MKRRHFPAALAPMMGLPLAPAQAQNVDTMAVAALLPLAQHGEHDTA